MASPSAPVPQTDVPAVAVVEQTTAPAVQEVPNKVFIGNLTFDTTREEVLDFFGPASEVKEVTIISRSNRPMGYGFAAFETPEAAQAAVATFDKKELKERAVNLELARAKSERRPRVRRARLNRKRGGRRDETEEGTDAVVPEASPVEKDAPIAGEEETTPVNGRSRGSGRRRGGRGAAAGGEGRRFPRQSRRNVEETGTPSPTTVFVANLPLEADNAALKEVFRGYGVVSASVIMRRNTGQSKGFGFVVLATPEEQKRAVESGDSFVMGDHTLVVRIAMSEPHKLVAEKPATEEAVAAQ
ncbi:hypothetical protein IWQ60_005078 [Tieghemiomyces parasiticus]|uniref:RRM domain-containing protein n=1 Tax=Tieghemiomyces parasiticus TaxID=78921 RepID=A0A9W8A9T0_9FUNG|nr:hypothetical protein IWQ60_005078 [Tieghemiomyces parasiticus]